LIKSQKIFIEKLFTKRIIHFKALAFLCAFLIVSVTALPSDHCSGFINPSLVTYSHILTIITICSI
jgi:hypothetical protein